MKKLGELAESNPTPEAILKALHDHPEIALPTLKEIGNYHSLSKGAQDEIVGYQSSYAPSSTGGGHKVLRRTLTRVRKALPPAPTLPPVPPHEQLFMYLQILTACLKSYAHGANDTSNAAGPYAAVQALYLNGPEECSGVSTPIWVLFFIGGGIVVGLSTWGYKVMETVGKGLISINFPRGFVIELGSTFAVVLASVAGMPVSSTHCQIGSVVAVGILQSRANVEGTKKLDWSVFRQIVISWIVTVPFAALAAAGLFSAFKPGVEV